MAEAVFAVILAGSGFGVASWTAETQRRTIAWADILRLTTALVIGLWAFAVLGAALAGTWSVEIPVVVAIVVDVGAFGLAALIAFSGALSPGRTTVAVLTLVGLGFGVIVASAYVLLLVVIAGVCVARVVR